MFRKSDDASCGPLGRRSVKRLIAPTAVLGVVGPGKPHRRDSAVRRRRCVEGERVAEEQSAPDLPSGVDAKIRSPIARVVRVAPSRGRAAYLALSLLTAFDCGQGLLER